MIPRSICTVLSVVAIALCSAMAAPGAWAAPKKKAPAKPKAAPAAQTLPWTLRDHMSLKIDRATLRYAGESADWALEIAGHGTPVSTAGFAVVLGDGAALSGANLGAGLVSRDDYTEGAQQGKRYSVTFPPRQGLEVRHEMLLPEGAIALQVRLHVRNGGTAPVAVARLAPVVLPAGSLAGLPAGVAPVYRRLDVRAGFPFVAPAGRNTLALLADPKGGFAIALGVLPSGESEPRLALEQGPKGWAGEAACHYAPPVVLEPGEAMVSEGVWLSPSMADLRQVQRHYGHAIASMPRPKQHWSLPRVWAALPADADWGKALGVAQRMREAGAGAALIPAVWESSPGSLQGGGKGYPRNMGGAAGDLKKAGLKAGIVFDPLATDAAEQPGVVAAAGGARWINPRSEAGYDLIRRRAGKLKSWGFDFAAGAPSAIPDEALAAFGIARAQADSAALDAVCAAEGLVAFPAPASSAALEADAWLEAAGTVSPAADQAVIPAPIRVDVADAGAIGDPLLSAMRLWPGPIVLDGVPNGSAHAGVGALSASRALQALPMDPASAAPKLWRIRANVPGTPFAGASVLAFAGGPSWDAAWVPLREPSPLTVWRADDGRFVDGPVAPVESPTFFGVTPKNGHPTFMGTGALPTLGLERLARQTWNEAAGTLSLEMTAGPGAVMGYVYVPAGWDFEGGKAGREKIEGRAEDGRVAFGVGNGAASVELRFKRR